MNHTCQVHVGKDKKNSSTSYTSTGIIKAGTLLLSCKPFAFSLNNNLSNTHCDNCFKTTTDTINSINCENGAVGRNSSETEFCTKSELFRCGGCQLVRYCNKDCQKSGWDSGHNVECKPMKIIQRIPPTFARLVLRVIIKLQAKVDFYDKISEKHHRRFRDLMSHYNDVKKDSSRQEHIYTIGKVLESILRYQKKLKLPNESELAAICGRIYVNTFRINNSELASLGTGLYLGASIFDHSCEPMAVATFDSTTINVRNIVDLPAKLSIEKVTISYQDTIRPTPLRIRELQNYYYFECQCERCSIKTYDISMNAIKCPNKNCLSEVNLDMEKCDECEILLSEPFISQIMEIEEIVKEKLETMHNVAYLDVCETSLKLMSNAHFSETHWLQTSMASAAFDAAIDFQFWERAWNYGKLAILGYRKYLNQNHPFLGVALLKMAKLSWFLEKENDAKNYITEAKRILDITHGSASSVHANDLLPLWKEISFLPQNHAAPALISVANM